jgi:hypothetical protein
MSRSGRLLRNTYLPHTSLTSKSSSNQGSSPKPISPSSANKSFSVFNTYIKRENYIETSKQPTFCYHNPEK